MSNKLSVTSHAMGMILVDIRGNGQVYVATMTYTEDGRTTWRLPMGKGKKEGGEPLTKTAIRESIEETAKDRTNFDFEFLVRRLVYFKVVPDDNYPETDLHLKGFMVGRVTQGELRDYSHTDGDGETLGPMCSLEAGEVIRRMSVKGQGLYVHTTAVMAAINALAQIHPPIARCYDWLLSDPDVQRRIVCDRTYQREIEQYISSLA